MGLFTRKRKQFVLGFYCTRCNRWMTNDWLKMWKGKPYCRPCWLNFVWDDENHKVKQEYLDKEKYIGVTYKGGGAPLYVNPKHILPRPFMFRNQDKK